MLFVTSGISSATRITSTSIPSSIVSWVRSANGPTQAFIATSGAVCIPLRGRPVKKFVGLNLSNATGGMRCAFPPYEF